jgi:hypothetical protein
MKALLKTLLVLVAIVLALPVLLVLGVALGPLALVLLYIVGFAALVTLTYGAVTRHSR